VFCFKLTYIDMCIYVKVIIFLQLLLESTC